MVGEKVSYKDVEKVAWMAARVVEMMASLKVALQAA